LGSISIGFRRRHKRDAEASRHDDAMTKVPESLKALTETPRWAHEHELTVSQLEAMAEAGAIEIQRAMAPPKALEELQRARDTRRLHSRGRDRR
jgi:hypothetical protein